TPTTLTVGTHTVLAQYNGSPTHAPSSDDTTLTVGVAPTTTVVTCVPASVPAGTSSTCTATVTDTTTPTGTVTFSIDGTQVGSPVNLTDGSAAITTPTTLTVGTHTVLAQYNGSPTHAPSSDDTTLTVTAPSGGTGRPLIDLSGTVTAFNNIAINNNIKSPGGRNTTAQGLTSEPSGS
ncbi:Ig-like domain repeat protein, partial [Streptomyces bambusae]